MIVSESVERYLGQLVPERSALLQKLEQEAKEENIPIIKKESAQFLRVLLKMVQPSRILEIGTAIGYSTIWMAEAAPHARITTMEIDADKVNRALENFSAADVRDRIELLQADAGEGLPDHYSFDFIFLDAAKKQYRTYLDLYLPHLKDGGIVAADNVLFQGRVAEEKAEKERLRPIVEHLRAFNDYVNNHPALDTTFVPVGDGLSISVYRSAQV